jgi:hypothetical protein
MEMGHKFMKFLLSNFILSNLPIIIAPIILTSAPFLLLLHEEDIANQNASYAYYLLIVGVIWKLIQFLRDKPKSVNNINRKNLEASH